MADNDSAIGIFDSGVGGLTVFREVVRALPNEPLIYLGDTARVPYGTKSAATVTRYALNCADTLREQGIKMLIVACNTASAYALEALQEELPIPVLGVIEPGARQAVSTTRSRRIGILGTTGTVASGAYQRSIAGQGPGIEVFCRACPLFVPLAEEGWIEGAVPEQIVRSYLHELLEADVDTLVLGCTHYPLLKPIIAQVAGTNVTVVDSAEATATSARETIDGAGLARPNGGRPERRFLVTDDSDRFRRLGKLFVGHELDNVEWIDLD